MVQRTELAVSPRTVLGKATKKLRKEGLIPANIYGHKQKPEAVQVERAAFESLRRSHSTRNVLTLRISDGPVQTVLIRHVQINHANDKILHIDFARVNLNETIATKVPLNFIGEAPGVKLLGGVLLHLMETLEVECLVSGLVEHLDIDVSSLEEIDAVLHAKDVQLPTNFKLITDAEEPIAKIAASRAELTGEAATPAAEPATTPTTAASA